MFSYQQECPCMQWCLAMLKTINSYSQYLLVIWNTAIITLGDEDRLTDQTVLYELENQNILELQSTRSTKFRM